MLSVEMYGLVLNLQTGFIGAGVIICGNTGFNNTIQWETEIPISSPVVPFVPR